jgi:hypothetical protein
MGMVAYFGFQKYNIFVCKYEQISFSNFDCGHS